MLMPTTRDVRSVALDTWHRRLAGDFLGWDDPNHADYLLPIPPGERGVVTSVESHGSPPYPRYTVRSDATRASGLTLGTDFTFMTTP